MSEQQEKLAGFMAELDQWTQESIIEPLMEDLGGVAGVEINLEIRKAIRTKVLESYKNGCRAGAWPRQKGAEPCSNENSVSWPWP